MFKIKSGYGTDTLPFWAVFNLYVIFICTSIPGLAISPIMGDLTRIFPGTTPLESQFLEIGPNIAAIPFVFLGGWIGTKFNNNKLTTWTCLLYGICGILFFFVPNMISLIVLSFLIGIFAGIISPLSSAFIADMFGGKKRTAQYGYTSATLNLVLMLCTIATGYLAKIDWRLPFMIYLLPIVPLFFAKHFGKYVTNPQEIRTNDAKQLNAPKVHYKFSREVNMGMLVRYCVFYFVITFVIAAISLYLPFRYTNSSTAGDLTSILFFGIMLSGYFLNWFLKLVHNKGIAIMTLAAIAIGFLLMSITSNVIVVGFGILLATFFYGIAQPYYYNRLSVASSRIALTLTLAWFAVMDSIGNVVAAPLIDLVAKLFHRSTSAHPLMAFKLCVALAVISLAIVIIRKVVVAAHHKFDEHEAQPAVAGVPPVATVTTAKSAHPMPGPAPGLFHLAQKAEAAADKAEAEATKAVNEAKTAAADAADAAKTAAADASAAAADAKTAAEEAENAAKTAVSNATDAAKTAAADAADAAKKAAGDAKDAAADAASSPKK